MSDFEEDEMEVDGHAEAEAMIFSAKAAEAKGKRNAANLPVELEDSLPWCVYTRKWSNSKC